VVDMEHLSANVVERQGHLAAQVLPPIEETNLSLLANVVSDTVIDTVSNSD